MTRHQGMGVTSQGSLQDVIDGRTPQQGRSHRESETGRDAQATGGDERLSSFQSCANISRNR